MFVIASDWIPVEDQSGMEESQNTHCKASEGGEEKEKIRVASTLETEVRDPFDSKSSDTSGIPREEL